MKRELTYHHIGIPTEIPREDEVYLEQYRMIREVFQANQLVPAAITYHREFSTEGQNPLHE